MREFKRGLKVGSKCLTRHPSSNLWTTAKILKNHDDSLSLEIENWPDVVKCGIWFSQIFPVDTFSKTSGASVKDKNMKAVVKSQSIERKLDMEIQTNEDLIRSESPQSFIQRYIEDLQVLLSKFDGNCVDKELISGIGRVIERFKEMPSIDHDSQGNMTNTLNENMEFNTLTDKALQLVENWKWSIATGTCIDIYHKQDEKWFHAKVKDRRNDAIDIHFNGWAAKYDETVDLVATKGLIYPEHTFTKKRKKAESVKRGKTYEYIPIDINADGTIEEGTYWNRLGKKNMEHASENSNKTWITGSGWVDNNQIDESIGKTGRRIIKRHNEDSFIDKNPIKKSKRFTEENQPEDNNDILCSICYQLEAADHSDLILCDGPCLRSWHLGCIGLDPNLLSDEWVCEDCERRQHKCSFCGDFGRDDFDVHKCMDKKCGNYFHYNCLTQLDAEYLIIKEPSNMIEETPAFNETGGYELSITELQRELCSSRDGSRRQEKIMNSLRRKEEALEKAKDHCQLIYKCPSHFCQTCNEFYPDVNKKTMKRKSEVLLRCMGEGCTKSFHFNCLPPGGRYGKDNLCMKCICPDHPDMAMPSFKTGHFAIDEKPPGNALLWDQLTINLQTNDPRTKKLDDFGHFRLSTKIRHDVMSAAPQFKHLFSLDYDALPGGIKSVPLHLSEVCCNCEVPKTSSSENSKEIDGESKVFQRICGSGCLNRTIFVECYDIPGKKSDQICNAAYSCNGDCGNRQFQKRQYVKVKPFMEGEMGWGLKTADSVKKGALVIEYLGEVIDEEEMNARMHYQRTFTPRDHDFYIMELENGLYVDGKWKGNFSRFINHSCNPNCELVRWNVRGRMRIGIFALRDIDSGEALSYDYQFDTKEAQAFKCHCGASNCRGTMAPKERESKDVTSLSKEEKARMITAGRQRDRQSREIKIFEEVKRSCVSRTLPGDKFFEVRDGPLRANVNVARFRKIFLPRNTSVGFKFLQRRDLLKQMI